MDGLQLASVIFGIVGTICAIIFAFIAYKNNKSKDDEDDGRKEGAVLTEIGYIKSGIDDIKYEQREQRKTNDSTSKCLARLEESTKQAHKRIDALEKNM